MRKILFVHKETYVDRALKDVQKFFEVESRHATESDLLAVIIMPVTVFAQLYPPGQERALTLVKPSTTLFGVQSMSINGIWTLLTINQPELLEPTSRQETLIRTLNIIREHGCLDNFQGIFPVFPAGESEEEIKTQMAYLGNAHPDLLTAKSLTINHG